MRIIVDINHPAHIHYFKNFIFGMKEKGHRVLITASQKDVTYELLDEAGLNFVQMGSYGSSFVAKALNLPLMDLKMIKVSKEFNPDVFLGFGSIRGPHAATLLKKISINFEDTEHSLEQIRLYMPAVDAVCTPKCFGLDLGHKHIRYDGHTEISYLHPRYFRPDPSILDEVGVDRNDRFSIIRFVSWKATHDKGRFGISDPFGLVKELSRCGEVFISSEGPLPIGLREKRLKIPPGKFHDLLYYATLHVGEGATVATESALLGTPSIYISTLAGKMGNLRELENEYGLVYSYKEAEKATRHALDMMSDESIKSKWKVKQERYFLDKIDVTAFMVDMIENVPESIENLRSNRCLKSKTFHHDQN